MSSIFTFIILCNIYFCTERKSKLDDIFTTLNSFVILDINELLANVKEVSDTPYTTYYINKTIQDTIDRVSELKVQNVLYMNRNLSESILESFKKNTHLAKKIGKYVIVDNGFVMKNKHLYNNVDEVLFYTKNKKIRV